jgi:PAS domain S-box-containing protein
MTVVPSPPAPASENPLQTPFGSDEGNAAALLAGVLDSAMDAVITIDEQQRIRFYNRSAEKIFGWSRQEVLGQPLERLLPQRFRPDHGRHIERFGQTGVTTRQMGSRNVIFGLRASGDEFPLDASISQLDSPGGKLFTVILRDISELLKAEQEHERLANRLAGLLDSAMDAIITVDESQRIILYNRAAERIFGWPGMEVLGQPLLRLLPQRFRAEHENHVRQFGATGVTSRQMGDGTVIHGLRANGEEFPMDASISQLETAEGKLYTVIVRDVTERVRAQHERSAFAAAANAIREEEKSRVARELHVELAQSLTVLKMDANWVRDHFATDVQASAAKLTEMLGVLDHTIAATRRIASDLRPLLLDDLGLQPAIEWLAANFSARYKVPCKLRVRDDLDLAEPYATAIFRIVQESLANVGKHAHATRVQVVIEPRPGAIDLAVIDDGRGYDPDAPRKAHSLGLMGVRERVHLLYGSMSITTRPGHGTRIEVRIPLPAAVPG